jgi:putative membrane protein
MLLEQVSKLFDVPLIFTGIGLLVPMSQLTDYIISTLIFVAIGLIFFAIAFLIIVKVTPFSIRKEIEEDQNTSLAIVIGSVIIGIALIVAAAVHG